jgi:hypothetical protein
MAKYVSGNSGGWRYGLSSTSATSPSIASPRPCSLIASDRVEGTAVYNAKRIGKVERLVIDKASGCVAYVVLSFGGFLGIGADHYRIPWPMLDYDEKLGGYCVDITEEQLKNAPKIEQGKAGSKRTGTAARGSMVIGSNPHRCKSAKLHREGRALDDRQAHRPDRLRDPEFRWLPQQRGSLSDSLVDVDNEKPDGFQLDITEEQLKNAPKINKGKTGSKRIGPATRTSTTIGKSDTIGLWNRRDRSQQFGPQRRSVS